MLLAVCVGFAAALVNFAAPVLLIPAIALIGAFGFIWGTGYAAASLIFACIGILGINISNSIGIIFIFIPFLAASAVLIGGFRRKLPYRYIVMLLAFFMLVSLYGQISVPALLEGEPPYTALVDSMREWKTVAADMGLDVSGFSDTISMIPTVFYGYLIFISEFIGFIIVVLSKYFCTLGKSKPRPMAKFADWQLPSSLRIGVPVLAVGCIIAFIAHFNGAEALLMAVLALVLPPLTVQGLSTTMFMMVRSKKGKRPSGFAIAMLIILLLFSPILFSIFGIIELYARSRDRFRKYDRKIREAFEKAERTGSNTVSVDLDDGEGPRIIAVRKKNEEAFYDSDLKFDDEKQKTKDADDSEKYGTPENNAGSTETGTDENVSDPGNAASTETGKDENASAVENTENAADTQSSGNISDTENTSDARDADYTDNADSTVHTDEADTADAAGDTDDPDKNDTENSK